MRNEGRRNRQGATKSGPQPGNFALGSEKSRAAARAAMEARDVAAADKQILLILMKAGQQLDTDECIEILRDLGRLPKEPIGLVVLSDVPKGLGRAELEKHLREHGTELCDLSCDGTVE